MPAPPQRSLSRLYSLHPATISLHRYIPAHIRTIQNTLSAWQHPPLHEMNMALSPTSSPKVKRKGSVRRPRAGSHLPPLTQENHESALHSIRQYLKNHTSYDSFPVSFRMIVLDSKLEVKKALQCLLSNGMLLHVHRSTQSTSSRAFRRGIRTALEQ